MSEKTVDFKSIALELIDSICEQALCDNIRFNKDGTIEESKQYKVFDTVYKIAHAACDTECSHPEWEQEVEDMYLAFKEQKLI